MTKKKTTEETPPVEGAGVGAPAGPAVMPDIPMGTDIGAAVAKIKSAAERQNLARRMDDIADQVPTLADSKRAFAERARARTPPPPAQARSPGVSRRAPPAPPTNEENEQTDGTTDPRVSLCAKLNGYRNAYRGKLEFDFAPFYDPNTMSLAALQRELSTIQLLVNASFSGDIFKELIGAIGPSVQRIHVMLGQRALVEGRINFAEKFADALDGGYFDAEILQLQAEYAHVFAWGPVWRVVSKTLGMYKTVAEQNMTTAHANPADLRKANEKFSDL